MKREQELVGAGLFTEWFQKYKSDIIPDTMIKSVRESAGMGSQPEQFTTNASESINAVMKVKVDYKRNQLPVFIAKMQELVSEQQTEVKKAVLNQGKYQLKRQYQHLGTSHSKWYKMSKRQRHVCLQRFNAADVANSATDCTGESVSENSDCTSVLGIDVHDACKDTALPIVVLKSIWRKAADLVATDGAIALAPGLSPQARTVRSTSRAGFNTVKPGKNGRFVCECSNSKSLGICSHSVATAHVNGSLLRFIAWFKKGKRVPNMTKLVLSDVPKGCGKKGSKPKRGKTRLPPVANRIDPFSQGLQDCQSSPCSDGNAEQEAASYKGKGSKGKGSKEGNHY